MPIILGGDHSIGFPTVRGLASVTSKNIGIIHVDRHADIQEKDLDERMHTTPYFHATNLPNVKPKNLVQIGIGGWQVPRPAVPNMVERETNIFTMDDVEEYGIDKIAEMALDRAWDGCDAVYMSYDIDSIEAAFVPGYVSSYWRLNLSLSTECNLTSFFLVSATELDGPNRAVCCLEKL